MSSVWISWLAIVDLDIPVQDVDRDRAVVDDLTEDIQVVRAGINAAPVVADEKGGQPRLSWLVVGVWLVV